VLSGVAILLGIPRLVWGDEASKIRMSSPLLFRWRVQKRKLLLLNYRIGFLFIPFTLVVVDLRPEGALLLVLLILLCEYLRAFFRPFPVDEFGLSRLIELTDAL
jgi:hypothetical protein